MHHLTSRFFFVIPQQAEVAQEVPGTLRPRIFFMFGTTRLVGRQPYSPAAFTPGEIPGTRFQRLSRPQGKKSPVTPPGIDPGTFRLVAQCLFHYATPGTSRFYKVKFRDVTLQVGWSGFVCVGYFKLHIYCFPICIHQLVKWFNRK